MPMLQESEEPGLLNRKIVVEKVKSVFSKTLKKPFIGKVDTDEQPPPLPPKTFQKPPLLPRPALPPPLPPRKAPLCRELVSSPPPVDPSVSELVQSFTKLQENVLVAPKLFGSMSSITTIVEVIEEPISDDGFGFFGKPPPLPDDIAQPPPMWSLTTEPNEITFSTFKPKPDWKDAFFQPVKIKLEREGSASKLPKLVEGMLHQSEEQKSETYKAETLKRCKVRVSDIVSSFEQKGNSLEDEKQVHINYFV